MKHIEQVRPAIRRILVKALGNIRGYISLTDGNLEAVDKLRAHTAI
jgi:hypothetical protein